MKLRIATVTAIALAVIPSVAVGSPSTPADPPMPSPPSSYRAPLWPLPPVLGAKPVPPGPPRGHRPGPGRPHAVHATHGTRTVRMASVPVRTLRAVNARRRAAGCPPVRLRHALNQAARRHSASMARQHRLSHSEPGGSSPARRMRAAGYHPRYAAENLSSGHTTAREAVDAWMHSPRHRDVILTCRYTHAGVGVAAGEGGPWWTLLLGNGH
ncbi:CAP domain-containing protein [Streptomyces syringium]|uniref:CAP domain-containing protein n=1 Tax=Streptomyces syringium TaxID=76729 RepID=UPI0034556540